MSEAREQQAGDWKRRTPGGFSRAGPFCAPHRVAEKQALARARRKAPAPFPECPTAPELNSTWQAAQEGRKKVLCDRGR